MRGHRARVHLGSRLRTAEALRGGDLNAGPTGRLQRQCPPWHERLGEHFPGKGPHSPSRGRTGGRPMSTTGRDFIVIGESIHATRVLLQKSERISANEEGEEAIVFKDEDGATLHLRIPEEEKLSQPYQEGRIRHVRLAVQVAMAGIEPDCSTALCYLKVLTQRQVKAGAHFLDVNVDEISNKLADQPEGMRWLLRDPGPPGGKPE